ncbi:DinB family protein [Pseudalkalibacillus salsuginis]|uniref:DinB family protein n=1 Tax=Pseudalkalibacillus salsuginis TaxID=2910972 RepID=UPI001F223CE0|nr:DinB family protein [Pseudalkalibacillus salsuginis]MCF6412032.1 DinB family protein [Pseudalkalibacillus salsuginis]
MDDQAVEDLSEEVVDIQPDGFNNTIRWHIGHIITETEYFMFELPCNPVQIPLRYNGFFSPGTNPSKWDGEVPLLSQLVATLKDQLTRVNKMSPEDLNQPLEENIHGYTIAAEAAAE